MTPSDTDLAAIESAAVEFAQGAGDLLAGYFGRVISVEYKDKAQQDPVTAADKETQAYLERRIAERFPTHGILGEEDDASADGDKPAADFLWVLDPLDGTTNFMNGLPVYASSIGVLHRGVPVAGAVYIPWPANSLTGDTGNGIVVHCRAGGGAFANGEPITVYQTDKLRGDRLVGLPGSFGASTRVGKGLKGQPLGQLRVTGSIAYELGHDRHGRFAVRRHRRAAHVGHAGRRDCRAGSRRNRDDPPARPQAVAPDGIPGADLGRQAAHHGGTAEVGRAAGRRESHPGPADCQ